MLGSILSKSIQTTGAIKSLIDNALDKSRIINSYVVHADDTQGNFTASKRCLGKESHTILCHMALDDLSSNSGF